jgi:D-glycero-alpha-D-manno-heptose-7-phosphate kinase
LGDAMIITRAPLRIPLGGGGTDLPSYYSKYGGFIVSAAIDKYIFVNLNRPKTDDLIRLKYSDPEVVSQLDEVRHPLCREALRYVGIDRNVEIASLADVPAGTGLGSSGSFLVGLLIALHALQRRNVSTQALAEAACTIEIERAGQPVGKHDQYLAAFGGLTCLEIDRDGSVHVHPLEISQHTAEELRNSALVFFTGIVRRSFDILQQQQTDTAAGDAAVIDSLHNTKEIGLEIKRALERGDVDCFGELLDVHWRNKKRRSGKISDAHLDEVYELARKSGALGGKLMGAGGGGFFLFYCPNGQKARLRDAMASAGLREMSFDFDYEGAKVLLNV